MTKAARMVYGIGKIAPRLGKAIGHDLIGFQPIDKLGERDAARKWTNRRHPKFAIHHLAGAVRY
jgi:hypothetical protein